MACELPGERGRARSFLFTPSPPLLNLETYVQGLFPLSPFPIPPLKKYRLTRKENHSRLVRVMTFSRHLLLQTGVSGHFLNYHVQLGLSSRSLKAIVNEETLLQKQMFPCLPVHATFVALRPRRKKC